MRSQSTFTHLTALSALTLAALASGQSGEESSTLVYEWQRVVSSDGTVRESTPITDICDWLDAGEGTIDLDTLEDSRGRRYQLIADAGQPAEGADITYSVQLRQIEGSKLSTTQRREEWLSAHPQAGPEEYQALLRERRERAQGLPTVEKLSGELEQWLSQAAPGDIVKVTVRLVQTEPGLHLPRLTPSLFDQEPAFALEQFERRLLAIEARQNELEKVQAPVIAEMETYGGVLLNPHWIINGFDASVTWGALVALAANPAVEHIERFAPGVPDSNDLQDMREATQMVQLHDAGFKGETGSGLASYNDICIAIIDTNVDMTHPAWDDWAGGPSRLLSVWRSFGSFWLPVFSSATTTPSHGTKVAGVAVADLMQGQDPAITSTADREARTGFAPEASFVFIEESGAGAVSAIEKAAALLPDVINLSMSFGTSTTCNLSASSNEAVDAAMLEGIFFAKSGGNNGTTGSGCNVGNPGAASGAFTVNQLSRSAVPLKEATVPSGASRGGDSIGRGVIAIAAHTGPEADTAAKVGGTYGAFGASSGATPVVAGSAACLKEHFLTVFGSSIANEVGFLYATMLLEADGQLEDGSYANTLDPMDELYGAGRLRMRMFNSAGMDAPWRMRLFSRVIEDGELAADMPVNPDGSGINQPLSSDVDRLRVSCFWHEPNIENGSTWCADIGLSIEGSNGFIYYSGTDSDPRQHIYLGNAVQGHSWTIRLLGNDVPLSLDSNYRYLKDERKVYVAVYWEDGDRDDADGPSADID